MSNFCPNCGKPFNNGNFCRMCGTENIILTDNQPILVTKKTEKDTSFCFKILNGVLIGFSIIILSAFIYSGFKSHEIANFILFLILSGFSAPFLLMPVFSLFLPTKNKNACYVPPIFHIMAALLLGFLGFVEIPLILLPVLASVVCAIVSITMLKHCKTDKFKFSVVRLIISSSVVFLSALICVPGFVLRDYRNSDSTIVINGYTLKNYQLDYVGDDCLLRDGIAGTVNIDEHNYSLKTSPSQNNVIPGIEYEKQLFLVGAMRDWNGKINCSIDNGRLTFYTLNLSNFSPSEENFAHVLAWCNNISGGALRFTDSDSNIYTIEQILAHEPTAKQNFFYSKTNPIGDVGVNITLSVYALSTYNDITIILVF